MTAKSRERMSDCFKQQASDPYIRIGKHSDTRSLDFAVNRLLMKLFKTANVNVIQECATHYNVKFAEFCVTCQNTNFSV